jgi:hypothetical protein
MEEKGCANLVCARRRQRTDEGLGTWCRGVGGRPVAAREREGERTRDEREKKGQGWSPGGNRVDLGGLTVISAQQLDLASGRHCSCVGRSARATRRPGGWKPSGPLRLR